MDSCKEKTKYLYYQITYLCKHAVKQFQSSDYSQCTFCQLLYKGICCGYPFELHRLVDAIQMGTHNMCFYKSEKERQKYCIIRSNTVYIYIYSGYQFPPDLNTEAPGQPSHLNMLIWIFSLYLHCIRTLYNS